ncbi:hypothetical protein DBB36_06710 [Flavobacterium sp. WLB]|uniref:T9SS sorting signal type C domain-containing protein n=1 Tax=Flavobacterium sp. WLB TaxID=2161662 RepID=UPI000D35A889|nr:T9SS sorting signal type C domain-containing protein [Flavobacterium sp. WLB]PUU70834.1 hypothetical protein DBB36_06710 [Flavobacterium sp. WLB]
MKKTLLFSFLFFVISFVSFGQTVTKTYVTATTPKTFTVPAGVTTVVVECWGGGGAGGGSTNAVGATARTGGGGGGGAYAKSNLTVAPTNVLDATVGAAGTAASGASGGNGGFSTVSINGTSASGLIYAAGGSGGTGNTSGGNPILGGTGGTTGNVGGVQVIAGGNGGNGESNNGADSGVGGTGSGPTGGTGGAIVGGSGNTAAGNPGSLYGGGGSGGRTSQTAGNRAGGAGAAGKVVISYDCPTSAGTLSGNQYICTYGSTSTTFASTVPGGTWTISPSGIASINSSTGAITATANGTATVTYTIPSTTDCPTARTVTRTIYVTNGPGGAPSNLAGSQTQCQSSTTSYTISAVQGSYAYNWSYSGTGATITPAADGLSASVTFSASATSGNIQVTSTNACGTSGPSSLFVTIAQTSNGGTLPSASGCPNTYITYLNLTGYIGSVIRWESSTDNFVSNTTTINNTNNGIDVQNLTQTTYYRAVVRNSPCTNISYSTVSTITIGSTSYTVGSASSSPNVCINTAITNITHSTTGATGISNNGVSGANGLPAGVSASFASNTITISGTPTAAGTFNYNISLIGGCGNATNATGTITVRTNTVTAASSSPNVCINTAITNVTHTTTGATGIANNGIAGANGLPAGVSASWASNTITISGTPTASGIFSYSIPLNGGCGTVNATGTITVNANKAVGAASASPNVCINTAITAFTHTTTGGVTGIANNGVAGANGLPAGVSASWASNTITISGTPTASGTFSYSIPVNGCGSTAVNATGTITVRINTVTAASSSPTTCINTAITNITHTTTGATGIANNSVAGANGLPAGVSASWATNTITISGTPTASGNFTYSIPLNGGCGTVNATGTITVNANKAVGAASSSPNVCINTAITNVTHTTTGSVTGIANNGVAGANGLPAGVSASWASNTITISGTPTASGTFSYSIPVNGCGATAVNATGTITVNAITAITVQPTAPAAACSGSGTQTISVTAVGSTLTYVWKKDGTAVTNGGGVNGQGTNTLTLTNPTTTNVGNYTVEVSGSCGSTVISNAVAVSVITTDRGRTHGGRHICYGTQPNKLTLANADAPNQGAAYSYPEKVVRWEYSDDNNVTWVPIAGTANLIEYQPTELLYAKRAYRAVAQTSGCPQGFAAIETSFDIDPLSTVTFTSQAGTSTCTGTNVVYTTQGGQANYTWTISGNSGSDYTITGGGIGTGSNTVTLRWLTTGSKTVTVNYRNSNGCSAASPASSTTTVETSYTAPVPGTIVRPTCLVPTGSVTLSGLPNSGTLLFNGPNSTNGTYSISGTGTMTVSGLVPGDYSFAIQSNCGSVYSSVVTIQSANKWNGTTWSSGSDPTLNDILEFDANYSLDKDINGCSCKIASGANVTIKSGRTLTVTNALNVNSGGSLTFDNNASLVQTANVVNTGNITYKRSTTPINRYDYVYWSIPVTATPGMTLHDLSPTTLADKYQSFNPSSGWVISYNGTQVMTPGQGYIVRGPQENVSAAVFQASFTGVPNNGDFTITTVATKWHLIGNPYPSAISANKLITDAGTGALYFWTHSNQPDKDTDGNATYNYDPDDYSVYTLSGSTGTSNGPAASGKIAAGQGFFFKASTGSDVVFTNSMRIPGENSQFFKTAADIERNRVWLNMSTTTGLFKQALIGYIEGATNSWDQNYDAATLNGSAYLDFYSLNDAKKLTIQGRGLPFEDTDLVPLGYKTSVAGEFTIAIDHTDGLLNDQAVYLEDKVTSKVHDLKAGNYKFTTEIGTFTDRFVLRYTNKTLGTGDFENAKDGLLVSVKDKAIKVTSSKENIKEVNIYDITGKLLYSKNKIGTTELSISNLQSADQVLLVKVILENDSATTRKIIFK